MFRVLIQFIKKFYLFQNFYVLIIDCQKITEVYRRKLALDKYTSTLTAVTLFYSRIILKKLTTENKTTSRKLEKSVKFSVLSFVENILRSVG